MKLTYAAAIKLHTGLNALEQKGVFISENPKTVSRISITMNRLEPYLRAYEKRAKQLQAEYIDPAGSTSQAKVAEFNTKLEAFLDTEIEEEIKILPVKLADLSLKENKVAPSTLSKIAVMIEDLESAGGE